MGRRGWGKPRHYSPYRGAAAAAAAADISSRSTAPAPAPAWEAPAQITWEANLGETPQFADQVAIRLPEGAPSLSDLPGGAALHPLAQPVGLPYLRQIGPHGRSHLGCAGGCGYRVHSDIVGYGGFCCGCCCIRQALQQAGRSTAGVPRHGLACEGHRERALYRADGTAWVADWSEHGQHSSDRVAQPLMLTPELLGSSGRGHMRAAGVRLVSE